MKTPTIVLPVPSRRRAKSGVPAKPVSRRKLLGSDADEITSFFPGLLDSLQELSATVARVERPRYRRTSPLTPLLRTTSGGVNVGMARPARAARQLQDSLVAIT